MTGDSAGALDSVVDGMEFTTARRTITEADIGFYAGLSNDFNPLHVDEPFARERFGRRIAHGQLIASVVTGLRSAMDDWPVVGYLGATRSFLAPVGAGDTIHGRYTVSSSRVSRSRPSARVTTVALVVVNQDDEEVMTGTDVLLLDPTAYLEA
jgi:3-hydroxybutyryl-CoA dehydratase